jgi:hypothetical protein
MNEKALASEVPTRFSGTGTVKATKVPKGYLSVEELTTKYPDLNDDYMTATKRDSPVMVWIDSDIPVYGEIIHKVERVMNDEEAKAVEKMRKKIPFQMAEERYEARVEMLPPRTAIKMTIANYIYLFGDPNYRFDLPKKPQTAPTYVSGLKDSTWRARRNQCLNRLRRDVGRKPTMQIRGGAHVKVPSSYAQGTYAEGAWSQYPPVYMLPPDNFKMVLAGEDAPASMDILTIEDYAWNAMLAINMNTSKGSFTDNDEVQKVKDILVRGGHVGETSSLTLVRSLMKAGQVKNLVDGTGNGNGSGKENATLGLEED